MHCCDATFATPLMVKPIELGADMTLQSTTKYYDGHNMTVGGAVACATKELTEALKFTQNMHGNIMSPFNAFMTLQTCKTMAVRCRQQAKTAQAVAEFLEVTTPVGGRGLCATTTTGLESPPPPSRARERRDGDDLCDRARPRTESRTSLSPPSPNNTTSELERREMGLDSTEAPPAI
jgi:hypothetical protein